MNLRKTLVVGAAALAGVVLGLTATATASTPTGSTLSNIEVNGSSTAGAVAITGTFKGGTASFGGGTYGCSGGSVSGTVRRGPVGTGPEMTFAAGGLNLTCSTPFGNATIDNTCAVTIDFSGAPNVHTGLTDTGTGSKFHRVAGTAELDWPAGATNPCVRYRRTGGLCTAYVDGTPAAYFDELVKTGGVQTLGFNGVGGSLVNATAGCFGQVSGNFTLNDIRFWVKPAAGSIDFATASTPTGSTLSNIEVNGTSTPGAEAITGTFKGGTASFGGGTYGCSGGSVSGTVQRGPVGGGPEMTFAAGGLNITCSTPVGNATIDNTCAVTIDFSGAGNVHTGLTDTGTGSKFHRVAGTADLDWPTGATNPCVRVRVVGGLCTAYVDGTPAAYFDELVKTGGLQTLGLNGAGGNLVNATAGCFGQVSGNFTLNDIRFWIKPAAGSIDFQ